MGRTRQGVFCVVLRRDKACGLCAIFVRIVRTALVSGVFVNRLCLPASDAFASYR